MSFEVDYFTLDATQSAQKWIPLTGTPTNPSNVAMDICGGTAQLLKAGNGDFGVDGTTIRWDSTIYTLYSYLSSGDKIRIIYDRS